MCGRYHQHKPREALELMFEIGQVLDELADFTPALEHRTDAAGAHRPGAAGRHPDRCRC
jgi:hypothetical protein